MKTLFRLLIAATFVIGLTCLVVAVVWLSVLSFYMHPIAGFIFTGAILLCVNALLVGYTEQKQNQ